MDNIFNKSNIRAIDYSLEYDDIFSSLENCFKGKNSVIIEHNEDNFLKDQVITYFIHKYKKFITEVMYKNTELRRFTEIHFANYNDISNESYTDIQESYDSTYYLYDCGGHEVFNTSEGKNIDSRLDNIYALVQPKHNDKILDIGCGRGELSYKLHLGGAEVLAIDYSKDAIAIAKNTYDKIKNKNLNYKCLDVFEIDSKTKFDKIVMADVVEHIEQGMLEKLLAKLTEIMNNEGILVIHTSPNKNYYDTVYRKKRDDARKLGFFMPLNPRSYYEDLMHINEQTPLSLEKTLKKFFSNCKVWTGNVESMLIDKTDDQKAVENDIFAVCAKNKETAEKYVMNFSKKLDSLDVSVSISANADEFVLKANSLNYIDVNITNNESQTLNPYLLNTINISYHIFNDKGIAIIFDGERTRLSEILDKGNTCLTKMKILCDERLNKGEVYTLRITMVEEGCFWFDDISIENSFSVTFYVE